MKLIFVTREGYRLPGARVRCYNFARELKKHGLETTVLSYADNLGALDGENERRMGLWEKLKFNHRAFRELAKEKNSVIYMQRFNYHSLAPYLAHLVNGNRIILDLDDWEMREDPRYYLGCYPSSKAHYFIRQISRRSVLCIAASRFLEGFLSGLGAKVCYIPTGVDTAAFKPLPANPAEKRTVISWAGTLHKQEYIANIRFALDCFSVLRKKYAHLYFEIAGDGIHKESLLKIIQSYNDPQIIFKGWIAPEAMPAYLASIDIGVLPVAEDNKFNKAKSPTKLFEYMAMAKPTVSSAIGENVQIIRDGDNGLLARSGDDFTEQVRRLVDDGGLRLRIGKQARASVESDYALDILGGRLFEAVKNACAE